MGNAVPVMKSLARLDRKTAAPARSAGRPQRFAGVLSSTDSFSFGQARRAPSVSAVSIQPGRMQFTWMLSFAYAEARLLVNVTTPPLLAA